MQTDENISFIVLRQFKKPVEKAGIACSAGFCYTGIVKRVCPEFGINTYADMMKTKCCLAITKEKHIIMTPDMLKIYELTIGLTV